MAVFFNLLVEMLFFLNRVLHVLAYWTFINPLSFMCPKKKNLILFWGRPSGFVDNAKYLYLYFCAHSERFEIYFVTKNKKTFKELADNNFPVLWGSFLNLLFFWKFIRAQAAIFDRHVGVPYVVASQYTVQLWHGIGLKRCDLNSESYLKKNRNWFFHILFYLIRRFPKYDIILSTSEYFTKNFFGNISPSKDVLEVGHPRNDVFFHEPRRAELIGLEKDVFERLRASKSKGSRLVFYAPTFRLSGDNALNRHFLNLNRLNVFSRENKILFVVKLHDCDKVQATLFSRSEYSENIILLPSANDVYPAMSLFDMLITDYSSIYFDFLLFNKPIIFFNWEHKSFLNNDVELTDNYEVLTPGPKCSTQGELEFHIRQILINGKDEYLSRREAVRCLAFKYNDGNSSERMYNAISSALETI